MLQARVGFLSIGRFCKRNGFIRNKWSDYQTDFCRHFFSFADANSENMLYLHEMKTEQTAALLLSGLEKVIKGKTEVLRLLITAYLTGGHVLLEDVPGVGKTTAVKTLAALIEKDGKPAVFKRIQCTPDLLPYDITGVEIFNAAAHSFEFMEGPVFSDILLADELNRTPPKVQSALLEAMAEKQVTAGTVTRALSPLFFTAATQNPVEHTGTYPLPAAQLDRFTMCLSVGYPDEEAECALLHAEVEPTYDGQPQPVVSIHDVTESRTEQRSVFVHSALERLIAVICRKTREHSAFKLGASPRGGIHLLQTARTFALMQGRNWVEDTDIKMLAPLVLPHRCALKNGNETPHDLIAEITEKAVRLIDKKTDWSKQD